MARRSKLSVESDHRSAASATGGLRCLLALDCVANIQQNLEIQLLAAIGEVERRHLCVVARGLRALERLAVHLVEVGKDAIAGSGHACLLQNVCGESGRLHAGWRGRLGRGGGGEDLLGGGGHQPAGFGRGRVEKDLLGGAEHQPARIERVGHRKLLRATSLETASSSQMMGSSEATTDDSLSPSWDIRAGG